MKVTEISVSVGGTVNIGNYENFKFDASSKAQLEEGENPKEVYAQLWEMTSKEITSRIAEVRK